VPVECVACAPDGSRAAAGGRGGLLRLYHLAASPPRPAGELRGHGGTVRCAAFASERLLVSGDSDGAGLVWRLPEQSREDETVTPVQKLAAWHEGAVTCAAAAARAETFATGGADGFVCLGKIGAARPLWREPSGGRYVKAIAFTAD